ncbi:Lytic transglycosylase catalytic [Sphingobium chlorophenolicum L-1]|uniref:Lytic transglycosylase catalytic n=1 Tax=Sphingobium chlorophenolicum L-1 TaxID=690566 RepID=F6F0P9_SPHCR|nr:lytic transglycosylase domain-containing protein [Sphingobium chlorophenolicum]AEG50371.1 Lytic transglycosylase catalytic [Sphingobium chlorophenolicum L-1]
MAALIRSPTRGFALLLIALAIPTTPLAPAPKIEHVSPAVERWRPVIAKAAHRFGVPQAWIAAVMQAESGGQTHRGGLPITSRVGAMGLMQVMPGTWDALRHQHGLGPDPHDPYDNIMAGAAYLRALYDRFGYPGLFAAYNAGPGRYGEHLRTGRPLPDETRAYIAQLAQAPAMPSTLSASPSGMQLFFAPGRASQPASTSIEASPANPLFVTLEQP